MNRKKIYNLVVEKLRAIQDISEGENVVINEDKVPIGGLAGFDSLNGLEFTIMINEIIPLDKKVRLCVSDDGKKPLRVKQIVDRLMGICGI